MNNFLQSTTAPSAQFAIDRTDPSLASRNMSGGSLSMEINQQHFIPDDSFWHDATSYTSVSPQTLCDYRSNNTLESPKDVAINAKQRGSQKAQSKEQSLEVILRRRAQNRASQQAYRNRKDRRVKELETQLKEMGEQNESLKRDHVELCAAHEMLKGEQLREDKKAFENEAELWGTETTRMSPMLVKNAEDLIGKSLIVKAMICKRAL